jgi:predicted aldo/keto reductase-like oxidoreductase
MTNITRRHFLRSSAAAMGALTGVHVFAQEQNAKRSATDWVTLNKSGVKVTRLGMGTGTNGGSVQRTLGQEKFTALVRHAYDRGVRFFDTADNYQIHDMVAKALEGIDRETYAIQTKMNFHREPDAWKNIDRFRKELKTDYFDSFLLHCATSQNWTDELKRQMDTLHEAKDKGAIRSHGASVHGLLALDDMTTSNWMDVSLLRVNHNGTKMDNWEDDWNKKGDVEHVIKNIRKIHDSGSGVIGMKIVGNGDFTSFEERDKSVQFVMGLDCVDAIIVGFKSPEEIDEMIELMDKHLNS